MNEANLNAFKNDGSQVTAELAGTSKGCTLADGTVYYIPLPLAKKGLLSGQAVWDDALVATLSLEVSDMPGGTEVSDYDETAGNWVPFNPSGSYVPVTGGSSSASTVTVAGGSAGGAVWDISDLASRRVRIKADVTTGGLVRFVACSKEAA